MNYHEKQILIKKYGNKSGFQRLCNLLGKTNI